MKIRELYNYLNDAIPQSLSCDWDNDGLMCSGNTEKEVKKVKTVGDGVGFERIRRITGYLVGTLDRFNNAKKTEVQDRVTHATK